MTLKSDCICFLDSGKHITAVTSAARMASERHLIEGLPAVRLRQQLREIRATLKSVGAG